MPPKSDEAKRTRLTSRRRILPCTGLLRCNTMATNFGERSIDIRQSPTPASLDWAHLLGVSDRIHDLMGNEQDICWPTPRHKQALCGVHKQASEAQLSALERCFFFFLLGSFSSGCGPLGRSRLCTISFAREPMPTQLSRDKGRSRVGIR